MEKHRTFSATVRTAKSCVIVDMSGDIDSQAESAMEAAYKEAETADTQPILLNFHNVGYINSTGIALIVGMLAQARKAHRALKVCGLSDHYEEIFRITRLSDFMTIYPDETQALEELQPDSV